MMVRGILTRILPAISLLVWLGACGGGGASGGPAQSGDSAQNSGEAGESSGSGGGASAEPAGPDCSDGTCFVCGEGLCPRGFYCDESAPGGAACSWVPECKESASCGCVKQALASCDCEEKNSGVFVRCD